MFSVEIIVRHGDTQVRRLLGYTLLGEDIRIDHEKKMDAPSLTNVTLFADKLTLTDIEGDL